MSRSERLSLLLRRLECDAHKWMLAWLCVPKNPSYLLVAEDGSFTIDQVPPGRYEVRAWHPTLGVHEREMMISPKGETEIPFNFVAR